MRENNFSFKYILNNLGLSKSFVLVSLITIFSFGILIGFLINSNNKKSLLYKQYTDLNKEIKVDDNLKLKSDELVVSDDINIIDTNIKIKDVAVIDEKETPTMKLKVEDVDIDLPKLKIEDVQLSTDENLQDEIKKLWEENSLDITLENDNPLVAIIIDDMGVDIINTNKILKLGAYLTASFLSYAPNLQKQINRAKKNDKEIMLHVAMQPKSNTYDTGPECINLAMDKFEKKKILLDILKRVKGYMGVNNHMGSLLTEDYDTMKMILEELNKQEIAFIDSKTTAKNVSKEIAPLMDMPFVERDVFLDDSNDREDIKKQLYKMERIAKKRGYSVAIGHPRKNTVKELKNWIKNIKDSGVQIVPISTILKYKIWEKQNGV